MVFGIDLAREPIDGTMKSQEGQKSVNIKSYNIYDIQILCISYSVAGFWQLGPGSVDIVKGWTRSTAVATILIGASEVDVSDPAGLELLKPLFPVPGQGVADTRSRRLAYFRSCILKSLSKVKMNVDEATSNFRNLSLSYRGSERQAPNSLQLALRFCRVMEIRQAEGAHPADWGCEQRLRAVVDEFHMSAALPQRHRVDEDRFKSLANLIQGTSSASRGHHR